MSLLKKPKVLKGVEDMLGILKSGKKQIINMYKTISHNYNGTIFDKSISYNAVIDYLNKLDI